MQVELDIWKDERMLLVE